MKRNAIYPSYPNASIAQDSPDFGPSGFLDYSIVPQNQYVAILNLTDQVSASLFFHPIQCKPFYSISFAQSNLKCLFMQKSAKLET